MSIYFVDEDYPKLSSWAIELKFRGYTVKPILDADRAFGVLRQANDIQWVIIDVMLAASEQSDSNYGEERTEGGLSAGLTLLEDLCAVRADLFPARAQLLTAATNKSLFVAATQLADRLGVDLTLKDDIYSPKDFGDVVEKCMRTSEFRLGSRDRVDGCAQ